MTLIDFLKDKEIVVLGYGKQGKATYKYLRKHFKNKKIVVADKNEKIDKSEFDENTVLNLGKDYLKGIEAYDLIIKTPGVMLKNEDISKFEDKIITDYDLLIKYTKGLKIGVTGTKGKSTTSTILYEMLKNNGKDAYLLGNIGNPILDVIDDINEISVVVLEVSSHTLEFAKSSPDIAILLNIYPEHLDYYSSFEDYMNAKFNIARFQNENNFFIYNGENEYINNYMFNFKQNDIAVVAKSQGKQKSKVYLENDGIYLNKNGNTKYLMNANEDRKIKGQHMLNNMMFVLAVSEILNLDIDKTIKAIKETNPLAHRLEYAGKFDGIDFYDDAIATIPQATINSIRTLDRVDTLICGGMDRGVRQDELISFLKESEIKNIICMPDTGKIIFDALKNYQNVYLIKTMEDAVKTAKEITKRGEVCLLSPSASSYNDFKNFEEKGNIFKKLAKEIVVKN